MNTGRGWIKGLYYQGKLYAIGGYSDSSTVLSACEAYDIATNTWSPIADLPNGDAAYQGVSWHDSILYICGGTGPGPLFTGTRAVNIYNPATNTWTSADSLPYPIDMSDACIIGDTIWIPGGYDRQDNTVYSTMLAGGIDPSNPTRITWSTVAQLPAPNFLEPAVAFQGKVYFWSYNLVPSIWQFNPATRTFDTIPYPPIGTSTGRCCFAAVRESAHELYKLAGDDKLDWEPPNTTYYKYLLPSVNDVGATRIIAPSAAEDSGDTVVPSSWIANSGLQSEGFRILMRIGTTYADTLCTVLNPGESTQVSFSPWVASVCGPTLVRCSTMLYGDSVPENNAVSEMTVVVQVNAQIGLLMPDTIAPGHYHPEARVQNCGGAPVNLQAIVNLRQDDTLPVYSDSATTTLAAWTQDTVTLGRIWNAAPGRYLAVTKVSWRHGVLDSTGSSVIVTGEGVEASGDRNLLPSRMEFEAARPNPFGARTLIRYAIPKDEWVSLQLFASSGRIVRTLSNEKQPTGLYYAVWDGRGDDGRQLPCGVYLCRLEAGGQRMIRKLVLNR
jgi:hypothetical protein